MTSKVEETSERSGATGTAAMGAAKALFVLTGFVTQLALPRFLGSPEEWGRLKTAMTVTAIVTNTLVAAILQTISKRTSEGAARADLTLRELLLVHGAIGMALAGGMVAAAPPLGAELFLDDALTPLLRVEAIVIGSYAVYATLMGSLNGRELFRRQASLDMGFSVLRTLGLVGGAALGLGALGALSGLAAAAVAITLAASVVVGAGKGPVAIDLRRWATFFVPIAIYQACLNGILMIDLPLMKRTIAELAIAAGEAAPDEIASRATGFYGAAQTFAFVPYQLVLAGTMVLFPKISRLTSGGNDAERKAIVGDAMRFSLLALLAMAAPIAGAADGVLRVAYPEEYVAGADALRILAPGQVCFALFVVGATVLAGADRPRAAAITGACALVVVVGLNVALVYAVGLGPHTTLGAATGTALGSLLALVIVGVLVHRACGAFLAPLTVARALLAGAAAFAVAWYVPHASRVMAIVACALGVAAYVGVLAITREIGARDLALVASALKSRRPR